MLPCPGCRRFVRAQTTSCPFCGQSITEARAPLGGFLGVLLGVSLSACGGGDDDATNGGSMTAGTESTSSDGTMSSTQGTASTTDESSSGLVTGPLYGPISDGSESSFTESSGSSDDSSSDSTGGADSSSSSDSSGTGDSTGSTGNESDSVGPLYGPATGA